MSVEQQVQKFLDDYLAAWNVYDVAQMRSMWDADEAFPIYVAEESEPLLGWDDMGRYWGVDRSKSVRELTIKNLIIKSSSEDTAIAFYQMRWNVFIPGNRLYPKPFGNEVRVSAHVRRKDGLWKLFHYIEAPLASMVQMRRMHEDSASEAFLARVADSQKG